jgi:hypothetical protein
MKRLLFIVLTAGALALTLTHTPSSAQEGAPPSAPGPQSHEQWVLTSLKRMESVKAGMTRADLSKVFEVEGGISSRQRRTYAYRECPYFKVDVTFQAVGVVEEGVNESPGDEILEISKPYVDYQILD